MRHVLTAAVLAFTLLHRETTSFPIPSQILTQDLMRNCDPSRKIQLRSVPSKDQDQASSSSSRRFFFPVPIIAAAAAFTVGSNSQPAFAAPPITNGEAEGLGARAERALRAKPPKAIRPKLAQDFAVLLMRSSYNALDQIDCIAMEQFQRDFYMVRQAEYSPYVDILGPGIVQQGMLSDPFYFDFISFAQYATIARSISKDPPSVFEEQQPVDMGEDVPMKFVPAIVRRDPTLKNNMLAAKHSSLVGSAILDHLEEIFGETEAAIPKIVRNSRPSYEKTLGAISQMTKLFLVNGFAFDGSTSIAGDGKQSITKGASGTVFCIKMVLPATLWSGKALQLRKASTENAFILKTATELLRRAGYSVAKTSVKYEGNELTILFTIV